VAGLSAEGKAMIVGVKEARHHSLGKSTPRSLGATAPEGMKRQAHGV
jgi:hypothetical protein